MFWCELGKDNIRVGEREDIMNINSYHLGLSGVIEKLNSSLISNHTNWAGDNAPTFHVPGNSPRAEVHNHSQSELGEGVSSLEVPYTGEIPGPDKNETEPF